MSNTTKVFGLSAEKGRWIFVAIGLIINLCLGSVYSWSVFRKPLEQIWNIGATESGLPFMFFLSFFAILMPFTGGLLDKYGPRIITIFGGVLVGIGWIATSFTSGITMSTITYGLIAGGGVGIVYGAPIALSTRWFPDKKGLAVGLTIIGFGLSPFITAPLARMLIDSYGPLQTFGILGILFFILIVLLAIPLKFPPSDWKPAGWTPSETAKSVVSLKTSKMLKTSTFYGLWFCYVIGTLTGLMAIGISSSVGQEIIKLDQTTAALAISVFAVFNGIGRPLFGWITDKINPSWSAIISFLLILLASIGMLNSGEGDIVLYLLCFCCFWLCLGGWLAIAPTATATYFGTEHHGKNYGITFTAYGVGAIAGTLISGSFRDIFGSYIYVFYPTLVLAIIGIAIAIFTLKPPRLSNGSLRTIIRSD